MRIRSIKPEFWRSRDIDVLPIEDRLLFIGLWSYVDDEGRGIDDVALIGADLFARDLSGNAPGTFERIAGGLSRLFQGGQITRYTVDGRDYLAVSAWKRHQRIDKPQISKFPPPDQEFSVARGSVREGFANVPEAVAPGTGEQRNRGTGVGSQATAPTPSPSTPKRTRPARSGSPPRTAGAGHARRPRAPSARRRPRGSRACGRAGGLRSLPLWLLSSKGLVSTASVIGGSAWRR